MEEFRDISDLSGYCLGKGTHDILVSTNMTKDKCKRYKDVMDKFDDQFKFAITESLSEQSLIREYSYVVEESADQYMAALNQLTEYYYYDKSQSEIIYNRLAVGISDDNLSQQLQMDPKLT